jgi:hypothetical protein
MRTHDHHEDGRSGATDGPSGVGRRSVAQAAATGRVEALTPDDVLDLQRTAGNAAVAEAVGRSPVLDVVGSGGGTPLDTETRADMEGRLGQDFGNVRVHTDTRAQESAEAVSAHAYTVGSDVVFGRGQYDPSSAEGKRTLAHELTHVVQQRSGPVSGTPTGDGIAVSDPSDSFEREAVATAERVNEPEASSGEVNEPA